MIEYCFATEEPHYQAAVELFKEYAASLHIDLGFQHFDEEIKVLGSMYGPPAGGIILAKASQQYIACVGIRCFEETVAELKRMYVQPAWQHQGIGAALLRQALTLARTLGYKKIYLDTLNSMQPAMQLYEKYGFRQIPAYYHNPNATAVYYEREI